MSEARQTPFDLGWPSYCRPISPEPEILDPGKMDRVMARAGILIRREIAAKKREAETLSHQQAARAIVGTEGGAAKARVFMAVPADDAGEVYLQAADGILAHLRATGLLTGRQCDAAAVLARLWGLGGGSAAWRTTGGGCSREEDQVAAARREYRELLSHVRPAIRQTLDTLSMGEWITAYNPLPVWREALDAVGDRLKLERAK